MQVRTNLDLGNVAKIINVPNPSAVGDAVNKAYVDSAIEGLAWKDSVRCATSANINLASPGASIDGISMVAGYRVLVRAQTVATENGIYIWNGAAVAMTRSLDASTFDELEQAVVSVEEGSSAGASFRQSAVNGVIGTNNVTWTSFGQSVPSANETTAGVAEVATQAETDAGVNDTFFITPLKLKNWASAPKRYVTDIGDGSATQYTVTHNLNTRDIHVMVRRNSGAYDIVICDVEYTTVNSATIRFAAAPAANEYRVIVLV